MKVIVQFSGGKDSMASLLWVKNNLTKKPLAVFCDTGWESPETYQYIEDVEKKTKVKILNIKSSKYDGFLDLARKKQRFPSTKARFCTEELKSKPFIDWLTSEIKENVLIVQGIRGGESFARSKMKKQCTFFKYYHEPYKKDKKGKNKFHTYKKKEVLKFSEKYSQDVLRPVFNWSGQQVIDSIIQNGFEPNPLYKKGMKRVGCYPCIMSNFIDIENINRFDPERLKYISEEEAKLGSSFFGPDKIPQYACQNKYPLIPEVIKYINDKKLTGDLFENEFSTTCMSFYGLCE